MRHAELLPNQLLQSTSTRATCWPGDYRMPWRAGSVWRGWSRPGSATVPPPPRDLQHRSGLPVHRRGGPRCGHGIAIRMDGRGRALDHLVVERRWWSVTYEDVIGAGIPRGLNDSGD